MTKPGIEFLMIATLDNGFVITTTDADDEGTERHYVATDKNHLASQVSGFLDQMHVTGATPRKPKLETVK